MKFNWKKLGVVFNPQDHETPEWMHEFAQAPCVLEFDDFIRVYFSCRPQPDDNGQYVSYSGYVDLDRNDLFKILRISDQPLLKLGALGMFDEFGIYPVSTIRKGEDVWLYYAGWTRCESVPYNVAIGLAISKDGGKTFNRHANGPILSYSPNEPFTVSGPKIRRFGDLYYLFYVAGEKWIRSGNRIENVFKIKLATSTDGVAWTKESRNLIEPRLEMDECQASPDVIEFEGLYHMFYSYKYSTDFRSGERGYRIGYAFSKDLLNWIRKDSLAGLPISDTGWDSEMVAYPHVFKLNGKLYMMYLGNQVGKYGFGLAELIT